MSEDKKDIALSQQEAVSGIRWNESGLLPAVIQDARTLEVLMFAYMNPESLQRSLKSGQTWFWSRSRSELWHKGGRPAIRRRSPRSITIVTAIRCW